MIAASAVIVASGVCQSSRRPSAPACRSSACSAARSSPSTTATLRLPPPPTGGDRRRAGRSQAGVRPATGQVPVGGDRRRSRAGAAPRDVGPDRPRRGADRLGPLRAGVRRRQADGPARQAPARPSVIEPDFSHVARTPPRSAGRIPRAGGARDEALKARLLDQRTIAGVGNLLADEILWRARLSPRRPAGSLSEEELDACAGSCGRRCGGHPQGRRAHRRAHPPSRAGGPCPRCGGELSRATIGGRTTYWCSACQDNGGQ